MLWLGVVLLASASQRGFECIAEVDALPVYPGPDAQDVPTDSVLSVLRRPDVVCGIDAERWDVEVTNESGDSKVITGVLSGGAPVTRFPLVLQPHTTYNARLIAVNWGSDGDEVWRWSFTTEKNPAGDPRAMTLGDVHGLFHRVNGDVEIFPQAEYVVPRVDGPTVVQVQYGDQMVIAGMYNTDELGLPTAVKDGQHELVYGAIFSYFEGTIVERSKPDELCLTAVYVNAAGDAGEPDVMCGPLESFGCSSVGRAPMSLATLVLLVLAALRRRKTSR